MTLYVAVLLIDCAKRLVIPSNWIHGLNDVKIFNGCVQKYQTRKIFFSGDINKNANFNIPIENIFVDDEDACYKGKILESFGKSPTESKI